MSFGKCIVAGHLIFLCSTVFGAYPLITDDVGTVDPHQFEVEASYERFENESDRQHFGVISVKHGIVKKLDIGITSLVRFESYENERLSPVILGMKFGLVEDLLALGFANEPGEKEYFFNGILSHPLGRARLHVNLGYLLSGDEAEPGMMTYGSAVEYPLGRFDLVGEIAGVQSGFQSWLTGIRYRIRDTIFIGGGYGNGFRGMDTRVTAGAHAQF